MLEIPFKPGERLILVAKTGVHCGEMLPESLALSVLLFEFFQYRNRLSALPCSRVAVA